ncbi:MAG: tetratricopeptide repeat protein [Oligoflexia bacterium]|nr:tetratricopeptide repeat protein [Oligoflexia bacterium]
MNKVLIFLLKNLFIPTLFFLILFYSCSNLKNQNVTHINSLDYFDRSKNADISQIKQINPLINENTEENKKEIKTIDNKLSEITKAIKSVGEPAITYWASDMFLKASWASINGDLHAAMILLKNLHELKPEDSFITKRYAIELIKNGKITDAQVVLENLIKNFKHNKIKIVDEKTLLLMAGIYTALAQKNKARDIYQEVLKKYSNNQDACIFYAKSLSEDEKDRNGKKQAIKILEECELKNKDKHEKAVLAYYRGKIALEQKNMALAEKLFVKAMKLDSEYYIPVLALGGIYENGGKIEKAYGVYKEYLSKSSSNSGNSIILNKVVQVLFSLSKYSDIIPYLLTLSRMDPDDLNIKVKLAILYTDIANYEEAKKIFLELLKDVPDSDKILYYIGAIYEETKEFDKAIEYLSKVSTESPLFEDSSIQIAQILLNNATKIRVKKSSLSEKKEPTKNTLTIINNDKEKSQQIFINFIDRKVTSYPKLHVALGIIKANYFEALGDNKRAIEITNELRRKEGYNSDHDYYLSSLYEKDKNYEKSYEILNEILKKDPKNAHAWNFWGYSLLERGVELNKAFEYIKKALALKPDDGYIRDSLGWYYYKTGKLNLALKEIKFARKKVEIDSVISKHLAIVYHSLKNYTLAKAYYIEAYNNSTDATEREGLYKIVASIGRMTKDFAVVIKSNNIYSNRKNRRTPASSKIEKIHTSKPKEKLK